VSGFAHVASARLELGDGADRRAPGGAVTRALCGSWDHDGACRWPHRTEVDDAGGGILAVTVRFDAADEEIAPVRALIEQAFAAGELDGPDGRTSRWRIVGET
jgi:hypothetical protein